MPSTKAKTVRLEFVVWQFVRIMVELERRARRGPARDAYAAWREDWERLDRRLENLRKKDRRTYSDLMMEQQVVFEGATRAQAADAARAVGRVIGALKSQIAKGKDEGQLDTLRQELGEMQALAARLRALGG